MEGKVAKTRREKFLSTFLGDVKKNAPLGVFDIIETGQIFWNVEFTEVTIKATSFGWTW